MSCFPEVNLFVEECEKMERRKKFIIDEERSYRLRTSSSISQETSETPYLEECDDDNSRGIPDGIVKWNGKYRGRASGDRYSEEEILHAQREGLVLGMMTVAQGQGGYYREEVWMSPEEYLEKTEESYPDEVKEKALRKEVAEKLEKETFAREFMKENEELKAQLRRMQKVQILNARAQLTRKEEELQNLGLEERPAKPAGAEMVGGSHDEDGREVHRIVKSALTESCLNQLRESCPPHLRWANVISLKKIINNPTFTILQDEEGATPSKSRYGKGVMKKYKLYPHIKIGHGTGYLRWVVGDETHYLCGSGDKNGAGNIKSFVTNKCEALNGHGHTNWSASSCRYVGDALYYGLGDLIKSA